MSKATDVLIRRYKEVDEKYQKAANSFYRYKNEVERLEKDLNLATSNMRYAEKDKDAGDLLLTELREAIQELDPDWWP